MKVLILGSGGQVGQALRHVLPDAVALDRPDVDFTAPDSLRAAISHHNPQVILNAAAYTQVDKAEDEAELCYAINATAPAILAEEAARIGALLVHYSTDYVYDGSGTYPRDEQTKAAPLNHYGAAKYAGDAAILASGARHLIFRTSWVFDGVGQNFLRTMLRLAAEREELRIINDQIGAPSYAPHLAAATWEAVLKSLSLPEVPSGVYHLCNSGETSWYGFANAIFREAAARGAPLAVKRVLPITTSEYPTKAVRPLNSRLSCDKLEHIFGIRLPHWEEGMKLAVGLAL